ncbi:hypothetical protein [Haloferax sp. Atlit-4N]|uniref:hypothetical protein n=1 Tax=Haloferax sp. Atlit-4N TaxID=2077206 RepID=UPI0011C03D18|nr:hypothetical protein [Haloferax sp. Atlit-4N]
MDQQIDKIHREDQKAVGIFRVNLLVLGILSSALSLSTNTNAISTSSFLNAHTAIGVLALLGSSVVAAMAYTSSKFEMGIDPSRVESAANGEWSRKDFFEKLNEEYSGWVNHNNSVHEFNAQAITWAMAFAICGVILFSGGVLVGALQVRGQGLSYAMLIGELAVSLVLGLLVFYSDSIFERLEP